MAIGTAALVALAAASGNFEMPVVAGDANAGRSADGSTAVLVEKPARGTTRFAIVDTARMRVKRVVSLRGDFGFDALSPNGSKVYVIQYLSHDHKHYAVQSLRGSRLHTVVEKGEPGEEMAGVPLSRATTSSGGWVFTLYDGAGNTPFVHALQAEDGYTLCIDLDALQGRQDLSTLRLNLNGPTLSVRDRSRTPIVNVDTRTFEVSEPPPAPAKPVASTPAQADSGDMGAGRVALIALGAVAAVAMAALAIRRRT
ncbi:MAG: hypothetical protein QOJ29_5174, partial [Thermoleophilaceae bacterium]|nr:hypothetical protein [Thermoleophilaceae bacterium]